MLSKTCAANRPSDTRSTREHAHARAYSRCPRYAEELAGIAKGAGVAEEKGKLVSLVKLRQATCLSSEAFWRLSGLDRIGG